MCDFTTSKDIRGATSTLHITKYPQDIYFAIRPLYYFSRAVGLAPFSYITGIQRNINVEHHTSIKFSRLGTLHTVFLILLVSACSAVNLIGRITFVYPGMAATITVTDIMASLSSCICTLASFIIATTTGQLKLGSILQKITYIDEILLVNPESVYRKITLFLITELGLLFCIIVVLSMYDYFVVTFVFGNIFLSYAPLFYLTFLVMYTMETQFVNLILLIWHRYKILNSHLTTKYSFDKKAKILKVNHLCHVACYCSHHSRTAGENNPISEVSVEEVLEIEQSVFNLAHHSHEYDFEQLHTIRVLHSLLTDTALLACSMYGFQIILSMCNSLIRTTSCVYYSITYAVNIHQDDAVEDLQNKKYVFVLNTCWVPMFVMKMMAIAISCHLASSEANHTAILLQKMLLSENLKHDIKLEIKEFLRQVLNHKLKFKVYGFFNIDLSMLHAIIVAVFTYLLILIQFYIPN
jgi:hypothetical protein